MLDTLMIVCYLILYNTPFAVLRYYPFINDLRLPLKQLILVYSAILMIQIICFFHFLSHDLTNLQLAQDYRFVFIAIYLMLSFLVIKAQPAKHFFVYLIMFTYAAIVCDTAYIIDALCRHYVAWPAYTIINIAIVAQLLLTYPFFFRFFKSKYIPLLSMNDTSIWKYLCIIPLIFISFAFIFGVGLESHKVLDWRHYWIRLAIGISFLAIHFVLAKVMERTMQNATMTENIRMMQKLLATQSQHYQALVDHIDKARQAKHDLRHHILVMQSFLRDNHLSSLKEYLQQYQSQLESLDYPMVCNNYTIDAILQHYQSLAQTLGVQLSMKIDLADEVAIDDLDICIILGNLLENALEACQYLRQETSELFIVLHLRTVGSMLIITVDNRCDSPLLLTGDRLLSGKRNYREEGVGLASVRSIVDKYHGAFELGAADGIFKVSIMLECKN